MLKGRWLVISNLSKMTTLGCCWNDWEFCLLVETWKRARLGELGVCGWKWVARYHGHIFPVFKLTNKSLSANQIRISSWFNLSTNKLLKLFSDNLLIWSTWSTWAEPWEEGCSSLLSSPSSHLRVSLTPIQGICYLCWSFGIKDIFAFSCNHNFFIISLIA